MNGAARVSNPPRREGSANLRTAGVLLPLVLLMSMITSACRFTLIDQPVSILPGESFSVHLVVDVEIVPEPNIHKGVLCVLMPDGWELQSAVYTSPHGDGIMTPSKAWADSAEACYPAADIGPGMSWVAVISDTGFTYDDPFAIDINLEVLGGTEQGCYNLGYLVTKATPNLICSGNPSWAPLSYPNPIAVSSIGEECDTLAVQRDPGWEAILDRSSGWTGADGIYSIPMDGSELAYGEGETLLLFSDTFIGEVDENDHRTEASLVNNTYAYLIGDDPVEENISFYWGEEAGGGPGAVFVPDTPNSNPGDWYWLMDGIALDDSIFVFALRLESGGALGFEVVGTALLSFVLNEEREIEQYYQKDAPYYENEAEGWEIVPGQAIMPMHAESENPDADGYIYIYGPKSYGGAKDLVAARVLPEELSDFSQWSYWDGAAWNEQIAASASLTSGISQEFSVTPTAEGTFIVVFQLASSVAIRVGDSPLGPFGFMQTIWNCPEVEEDPDIFVYNAKAHPHLSRPGELLITYNVNTWDFWDHFTNADIYRPRFISLTLNEDLSALPFSESKLPPASISLAQNYPNPFNPSTSVEFGLKRAEWVTLEIFDIRGKRVRMLVDERKAAGSYAVSWDGHGENGAAVAAGLYFYRLRAGVHSLSRKMVLIK